MSGKLSRHYDDVIARLRPYHVVVHRINYIQTRNNSKLLIQGDSGGALVCRIHPFSEAQREIQCKGLYLQGLQATPSAAGETIFNWLHVR